MHACMQAVCRSQELSSFHPNMDSKFSISGNITHSVFVPALNDFAVILENRPFLMPISTFRNKLNRVFHMLSCSDILLAQ